MGAAANHAIDGGAQGDFPFTAVVHTPTLGVSFQQIEPDVICTAAGTLERHRPLVSIFSDDVEDARTDGLGFVGNAAGLVSGPTLEAEQAAEIAGDVP